MAITLPKQNTELWIARAIAYMRKLDMNPNNSRDIDNAISFVKNVHGLCPNRNSGFTSIEITTNISDDKIVLDQSYQVKVKQILDGLKLLKERTNTKKGIKK